MTLIVSCVTPNAVYQVSDRRLTSFSVAGSSRRLIESNANKLVFVNGRMSFGYTGISKILGQDTDHWLTNRVAQVGDKSAAEIFEHIRARATEDFLRYYGYSMPEKRHVFQIVGWSRTEQHSGYVPIIAHIENAIDPTTGLWLKNSRREFRVHVRGFSFRKKFKYAWTTAGYQLSPAQKVRMKNLIRGSLVRENSSPMAVIESIAIAIRELSDSSGSDVSTIGKDLLAVRIPRKAVERMIDTGTFSVLFAPHAPEITTFVYLSNEGSSIQWGPHIVMGDMVATGLQTRKL